MWLRTILRRGMPALLVGLSLTISVPGQGAQPTPPPSGDTSPPPAEGEEQNQTPTSGEPAAKPAESDTPAPADSSQDDVRTPKQPSAEDIIREFQKQRPQNVPLAPVGQEDETIVSGVDASPEGTRKAPLLPDGSLLVDRAGRVVKEGQWWLFVFESDNESLLEPPMKLLPCQALERMVRESRGGVDSVIFIVTAEVTDFKGENYILPRKVMRKRNLGNLSK